MTFLFVLIKATLHPQFKRDVFSRKFDNPEMFHAKILVNIKGRQVDK